MRKDETRVVMERWKSELIELGRMGRRNGKAVMDFEDITDEDGIYRIEGSSEMERSSTFLIHRMMDAGLNVSIDRVGNIFGTLRGSDPKLPAIMCGSHLDSVSNGGMFDGVAGVVCSLEALRRICEQQILPKRTLILCILMGEEGSAVDEACLGSRAICGVKSVDEVLSLQSFSGDCMRDLLSTTGKTGEMMLDLSKLGYFIELHIEQGPTLERQRMSIGVVEGIVGIRTYRVSITGKGNHAGSTPMDCRKDAFVAASSFTTALYSLMQELVHKGSGAVCTVDTVNITPNSPSVIPSRVSMTIDSRSVDPQEIDMMGLHIKKLLDSMCAGFGVEARLEVLMDYPPVRLDESLQRIVVDICAEVGLSYLVMPSGAIHDAMSFASAGVPSAMVFIPSKGGISHSPFEWTAWTELENGISILTRLLMDIGMRQ